MADKTDAERWAAWTEALVAQGEPRGGRSADVLELIAGGGRGCEARAVGGAGGLLVRCARAYLRGQADRAVRFLIESGAGKFAGVGSGWSLGGGLDANKGSAG